MNTNRIHIEIAGALAAVGTLALLAGALLTAVTLPGSTPLRPAASDELAWEDAYETGELQGFAATVRRNPPGTIEIAVSRESYRPGDKAVLRFWGPVKGVTIQVFLVGPERARTIGNEMMQGVRVTQPRRVGDVRSGSTISMPIGRWRSGLYFVRATAPGGRLGFAPFVVRPTRLGEHRVAIVMPTRTWQAYNFRDDDGDGRGDTWYANQKHTTVLLGRPYLNRGVPPHFRQYDLRFLHWLERTGRRVDVLSQTELEGTTGGRLAGAYDAIIFPGHHEYVTAREYDVVERYRDLGGNLGFLSANNYFWRIDLHDSVITRVAQWRDLERPESALIGVQYRGNDRGTHRAPWIVRRVEAAPWLFAGLGLRNGMPLGNAGIEIDRTTRSSPAGVVVLADVRDLFGPGFTAQMTYYETPRGARVFAAGAFTLAGSAQHPEIAKLLSNVWTRLTTEPPTRNSDV